MSPTARSLSWLRREGFIVAVVEKWNPFAGIRQDVWGIADVLACHPRDRLILLVQTTSASNVSHRLQKARARPELAHAHRYLECGRHTPFLPMVGETSAAWHFGSVSSTRESKFHAMRLCLLMAYNCFLLKYLGRYVIS